MCDKTRNTTVKNVSLSITGETQENRNGGSHFLARYTAVSILLGILSIWWKFTFVPESSTPGKDVPVHSYRVPLFMTVFYLVSLPLLKRLTPKNIDLKAILRESMVVYNVAQVLLNGWMVYRFLHAVVIQGQPFIGDLTTQDKGATYAIWVHYCDKYLEFLDTYFMVLRGKMDQVSFLHVYHHTTIAWAWWVGMTLIPVGDCYFGALLNSWIHVMMYSYYALSLLKVPCPWKKFLTQAQLLQFTSVVVYTFCSMYSWDVNERTKWHYFASIVQLTEMISLFVLFFHFYRKSYQQKKNKNLAASSSSAVANKGSEEKSANKEEDDGDDQCQLAVATLTTSTTETISKVTNAAITVASKESSKIVSTAKKLGPVQKHADATSRPSWSIVN